MSSSAVHLRPLRLVVWSGLLPSLLLPLLLLGWDAFRAAAGRRTSRHAAREGRPRLGRTHSGLADLSAPDELLQLASMGSLPCVWKAREVGWPGA